MNKWKKWTTLLAVAIFAMLIIPKQALLVSAAEASEHMTMPLAEGENIASGVSGKITWVIDADGNLTISGNGDLLPAENVPWFDYRDSIKTAKVNVSGMTDAKQLFYWCGNLESVDLSGFDTSKVTNMRHMFSSCWKLESIDLSRFDTSKVTDMSCMFTGCSSLTTLDVSGFDTSNVTDMSGMFSMCGELKQVDVRGFDTSKVTDMDSMFGWCSKLEGLDLSGFDTSNVTSMECMFAEFGDVPDLSSFNTSKVEYMPYMFSGCSYVPDLSGFDTSNVTDMQFMFQKCGNVPSLKNFRTPNLKSMFGMFFGCKEIMSLDLSGFDASKVYEADKMFENCEKLSVIYTPYNLSVSAKLPGSGWLRMDRTEITELPKNLSYSVKITTNPDEIVEENQNNNNQNDKDHSNNNVPEQSGNGNTVDESEQTGAVSGVLEETGSSADMATYGRRLITAQPKAFNTVMLTWDTVPGAKSYEIFCSTSKDSGFKRLTNTKKNFYKFSKAKCGETYYFQMRVCQKSAKSEFGPISYARTDLTGTSTLQVKKTSYNSVTLKWSKVAGAKKYEIFCMDSVNKKWESLGVKGGTSFTHKKLVTGATYSYQIRPVRDSFYGNWSNDVSATTVFGNVSNLKVKATGTDRLKLSWKKVKGATQYVILRADSIDGTYEVIDRTNKTSYVNVGLKGGTTYFYKVYAVSSSYKSKETAPVGQATKIAK